MEIVEGPGAVVVQLPDGRWELRGGRVLVRFDDEDEARRAHAKLEAAMKEALARR
jgi:hypothetical protein